MRRSGPPADERAVSTTVSYVLALTITSILISGLLIASGGVVENRRESVVREELRVIGQQVASDLATADRLAGTAPGTLVVRSNQPAGVAGTGYTVRLTASGGDVNLTLSADETDVSVRVPIRNRTAVVPTAIEGGDLRIVLTATDELEVRSA